MSFLFGICIILYLLKLSAGYGFWSNIVYTIQKFSICSSMYYRLVMQYFSKHVIYSPKVMYFHMNTRARKCA